MKVYFTEHFRKQLKRLSKKFPKVKDDLLETVENLEIEKEVKIKKSIYKVRIKSSDMNKGKSGGFRSYIYLQRDADGLIPLCIYFKSETESISDGDLQNHIEMTSREIALA